MKCDEKFGVWDVVAREVLELAEKVGVKRAAEVTGWSVGTIYRWRKLYGSGVECV